MTSTHQQPLKYYIFENKILTILFFIALQLVLSVVEKIVEVVKNVSKQVVVLQANTVTGPYSIAQDPLLSKQIFNSNNELNGLEYTYSMYLFISPETFDANISMENDCGEKQTSNGNNLRHIFHKGSKALFPLMSPGVFLEGDKNTMRIYMNSSTTWNNYVSIPNVPVNKWFHLAIMMKGKFMDVYINGNVAARQQFQTVPRLNEGNVYIMSPQKFPRTSNEGVTANFKVSGPMKGMVSKLTYYAYALGYSQIDDIYRQGPSKTIVNPTAISGVIPPYLHDDWWVTQY